MCIYFMYLLYTAVDSQTAFKKVFNHSYLSPHALLYYTRTPSHLILWEGLEDSSTQRLSPLKTVPL